MWKKICYSPKGANILVCLLFLCLISGTIIAQDAPRYLLLFKDKQGTPYNTGEPLEFLSERAVERRIRQNIPLREADLPVNPAYIAAVNKTGAYVLHATKWFNGVVVSASDSQMEAIQALPFYKGVERNIPLTNAGYNGRIGFAGEKFGQNDNIDYGNSRQQLEMLGVPRLHDMDYAGQGILIGVFDAGFSKANEQHYLGHLFENEQIVDTYDFISRNTNVYDDHIHGLQVLSVMAAKWEGNLVGAAFDADYVLYRTENAFSETPYEEVAWLLAAERADSIGVDVINTSLGYYDFDNAAHNYTYSQMDGKTTIISRAARYAARTGMLLVNSAGNEGNNTWKYITAPADVDSVLTVGAVTSAGARVSFSSIGPNAEGTIKPDVAALGSGVRVGSTTGTVTSSNGTSFSSPLIASFTALLWQVYPNKTAQEIADLVRSLGSQADNPNDELGYGIPYYDEVLSINGLIGFTAELTGNIVNLAWQYSFTEIVNAFEIERSFNNGKFVKIASVTGSEYKGDTLSATGSYYYRIRTRLDNGTINYSSIAHIRFIVTGKETAHPPVRLWPNPVGDRVFVDLGTFGDPTVTARVISTAGNIRMTRELLPAPDGLAEISVRDLPPGLYILKLISAHGEGCVQKFVKQ